MTVGSGGGAMNACTTPPADCPVYTGQRNNFCPQCKRADPARLRSLKILGGYGANTTNPNVERFLETGDPAGLRRGDAGYVA